MQAYSDRFTIHNCFGFFLTSTSCNASWWLVTFHSRFKLEIKRKVVFSTLLLTLPCIFLALLTLVVFCLPPDRPDRTALGTPSKTVRGAKPSAKSGNCTLIRHGFWLKETYFKLFLKKSCRKHLKMFFDCVLFTKMPTIRTDKPFQGGNETEGGFNGICVSVAPVFNWKYPNHWVDMFIKTTLFQEWAYLGVSLSSCWS